MENQKIEWTRVNSDYCGNPRFVCHFYTFIKESERDLSIEDKYKLACKRANKLGGKKFHNKQYGGGIVFQSYNNTMLEAQIREFMATC